MSLILEALKKSEAKRRLGDAPDLGTSFTTTRPRRNLLPFGVIAIAIAVGAGAWLLRQPATQVVPPNPANSAVSGATPHAQVPVATQKPLVKKNTPLRQMAAPRARQEPVPAAPARPTANPSAHGGVAPPMAVAVQPGAIMPSTSHAPIPARAPKTATTIGATPAPPPTHASIATPPAAGATAATPALPPPGVPMYYELPFSVRQALPPLKLSMHVYATDPVQRFVILDDSRLHEGDKTADGVLVRTIRPDGVILQFQDQQFFYPRDGF